MTRSVPPVIRPRPVTMADVAARAGVSVATVSRVISGSRPVSEPHREAVLRAAADLGYQVNLVGRALRKGRTATVGLLVPDVDNPFFAAVASRMAMASEHSDVDVLIFCACGDTDIERRGVESFLGRLVDAIVIIPCHEVDSADAVSRAATAVPTIQLDRRVVGADVHFVGCDNEYGIDLVVEHIRRHVDIDEQPVLYVGDAHETSSGHERLGRFRRHFPGRPTYLGGLDFQWGREAVDRIVDDGHHQGVIVTTADIVAMGIIVQMRRRGFSVPGDFRVIGFDGISVAHLIHPTLTTVRQPVEKIGQTVLDLISEPGSDAAAMCIKIAPSLVVGESSPA